MAQNEEIEQLQQKLRDMEKRTKELEIGLEWVIGELRKRKLLPPPGR